MDGFGLFLSAELNVVGLTRFCLDRMYLFIFVFKPCIHIRIQLFVFCFLIYFFWLVYGSVSTNGVF